VIVEGTVRPGDLVVVIRDPDPDPDPGSGA
jgi:hypothetical protein